MNTGYVYVVGFSNDIVKVGRTQNTTRRMRHYAMTARNFGFEVTGTWISPLHTGCIGNESELRRLARELGGEPTTLEFFKKVNFEALAERAAQLPFVAADRLLALDGTALRKARIDNFMTQADVTERVRQLVPSLKFSRSSLSFIESGGVKQTSPRVVGALAQVLGLDAGEIYDDEESEAA